LLIGLTIALAAIAGSCGDGGSSGVGNHPAENQELRVRIAGDPSTMDPQLASYAEEISVVKQLFRGLFTYDEQLNVVPAVALELPTKENGGISDDGLTYTIKLREDATWSDGQPVTANDFAYALKRLFDPEAGATGYYFEFYTAIAGASAFAAGEGGAGDVQVTALDDYTLQITLEREQPTLPTLLALWPSSPLREDVIAQHGDAWTDPGNLIGNGPFVLTEYAPEDRIVLEANPSYWGDDEPTLERLVYRIIPEDSAALIAYENNEIDVTSIPPADLSRYTDDAERIGFGQLETYSLQYNHRSDPFDDVLVRQAFSRAIDRDAFVRVVEGGAGIPAVGWLPPGMPGADPTVGADIDFDVEAARALLTEAGFADGEGFPTVTIMIAANSANQLAAEFFQEQIGQNLGIDIEIEALEEETYFQRYGAGDFEFTWLSWFADYADPENWLPQQFATDGGFNVFSYSNADVDELVSEAAVELSEARRLALYGEIHRLIIEDQAVTPVFHPERNYLVRESVTGLVTTALDASPGDWFVSSVQIMASEAAPPASEGE
jgi:oligopeptide transport system substrate-binding protein